MPDVAVKKSRRRPTLSTKKANAGSNNDVADLKDTIDEKLGG